MASIQKRGTAWFAQVGRTGHKSVSKSFPTKTLAAEWARKVEAEMDASQYRDNRSLNSITFGQLIERYTGEIGAIRLFGKNKAAVLVWLKKALGHVPLSGLRSDRLTEHINARRAAGARQRVPCPT